MKTKVPLRSLGSETPTLLRLGGCYGKLVRQLGRLRRVFEASSNEVLFARGLPLFPTSIGTRPSKAQVVEAWKTLVRPGSAIRPSGHSARRSGAKRRARLGWSLWQIQFLGRWAASTVLEYVEEAMAELTSEWAVGDQQGSSSSTAAPATPRVGSTGGVPQLSSRIDRLEELLRVFQQRLTDAEARPLPLLVPQASAQCLLNDGCAHRLPEGVLEWPRTLWASACGWRCGLAPKLQVLTEEKLEHLQHTKCARLGCWPSRQRLVGSEGAPAGAASSDAVELL